MPLYAYIKIPDIANSESTDEVYGKAWIPINSINLSNAGGEDDEVYTQAREQRQKQKNQLRLRKKLAALAQKSGQPPPDEPGAPDFMAMRILFGDSPPIPLPRVQNQQTDTPSPTTDDDDNDLYGGNKKSGGTLTFTKTIDSTSPKLHLRNLQCQQYQSDQYIKGRVEVHICRHIPGTGGTASREIYMAYIMENCLIAEITVDASETSKLNETVTLTFEKIHSCIIKNEGRGWDSKGWNFITEEEAKPPLQPLVVS